MNLESLALWCGYLSLGTLVLIALLSGYLLVYELLKAALKKIFLPIWVYNLLTTVVAIKCSGRRPSRSTYLVYLFSTLETMERRYPELRGIVDQYLKGRRHDL